MFCFVLSLYRKSIRNVWILSGAQGAAPGGFNFRWFIDKRKVSDW